jgi:hypothetical protein
MGKPISQRELAKRWKCSQPYIAKLVRRGMPLSSETAAAKWRQAESKRGALGARSKGILVTPVKEFDYEFKKQGARYDTDGQHGAGLVDQVMQLRETTEMFRREIGFAKDLNTRAQAAKNYAVTLNALRQFEKDLPGILKSINAVLDADQVRLGWIQMMSILVRRLRDMPATEAPNLANRSEDEIQETLSKLLEAAFASYLKDFNSLYAQFCEEQNEPDDAL